VPNFPRLRALALFGRRPAERAECLVIAGVQKPAQKRKSPKLREAASIASVVSGTDRRVMPFIAGGNSGAIA
jgi:hypothetical protein